MSSGDSELDRILQEALQEERDKAAARKRAAVESGGRKREKKADTDDEGSSDLKKVLLAEGLMQEEEEVDSDLINALMAEEEEVEALEKVELVDPERAASLANVDEMFQRLDEQAVGSVLKALFEAEPEAFVNGELDIFNLSRVNLDQLEKLLRDTLRPPKVTYGPPKVTRPVVRKQPVPLPLAQKQSAKASPPRKRGRPRKIVAAPRPEEVKETPEWWARMDEMGTATKRNTLAAIEELKEELIRLGGKRIGSKEFTPDLNNARNQYDLRESAILKDYKIEPYQPGRESSSDLSSDTVSSVEKERRGPMTPQEALEFCSNNPNTWNTPMAQEFLAFVVQKGLVSREKALSLSISQVCRAYRNHYMRDQEKKRQAK